METTYRPWAPEPVAVREGAAVEVNGEMPAGANGIFQPVEFKGKSQADQALQPRPRAQVENSE